MRCTFAAAFPHPYDQQRKILSLHWCRCNIYYNAIYNILYVQCNGKAGYDIIGSILYNASIGSIIYVYWYRTKAQGNNISIHFYISIYCRIHPKIHIVTTTPTFYILHITLATILIATIAYYYHEATKAKEVGDLLKQAQAEKKRADEYLYRAHQKMLSSQSTINSLNGRESRINKAEQFLINFLDDYDLFVNVYKKANPDVVVHINLRDDIHYSKLDLIPRDKREYARSLVREYFAKLKP